MKLYPMKRILVTTDLSPASDTVLVAAEELRLKHEAKLDVLYVSDLGLHVEDVLMADTAATFRDVFMQNMKKNTDSKIHAQLDKLNIKANVIVRSGEVASEIIKLAEEGNHDLVIMGHGRKNIIEKLLGSNASKVISNCPIPILVVKKTPDFMKVGCLIDESRAMDKLILGAFNFSNNFSYTETKFIALWIDLPKPFGNSEEGHKVQDKVEEEVKYFAPKDTRFSFYIAPTRELQLGVALEKILTDNGINTAVLRRFNEGTRKRVYIGSTTRRLLENFQGNILVIPPEE